MTIAEQNAIARGARGTITLPHVAEEMFVGGDPSPFTQDEAARINAASLVEDDTMGYLVIRLRKKTGQSSGELEVSGHVRPEWRNHFRATLDRVARGLAH